MNILYIVDDINSATGRCVINVAKKSRGAVILSTYKCNTEISIDSFYLCESSCDNKNQKIKILINLFRWPLKNPALSTKILSKAEDLICCYKIEMVVCVYNSIEVLIAGKKIKERFPQIKTVAYFLDAFFKGAHLSFLPTSFCERRALRWQSDLFEFYDGIVMMESVKKHYIEEKKFSYFNKIKFLDLPLIGSIDREKVEKYPFDKRYINCVYVGSLPHNIRNPERVCEVFLSMKEKQYRLYLFGTNDYKELEKKYCGTNIMFMGSVSYATALSAMNSADALINIGNSIDSMTPSKIFEYMNFGKKIISFCSIENDSSVFYINKYQNGLSISDFDSIEKVRKEICQFMNEDISENNVFEENLYLNTPEAFVNYVNEIYTS